ncbi:hypothetical protein SAMN02745166_04423 [Prosthecobacter debontii]|uniref:Uncharacterized protein n=1 Tax=Prosthecobacter debontii TaxID=48467 RepID=A0A1T4YWQ5_9BACT|nr:hypothetical protein SAMN02745166_04423 [Prosthecobacter debontii]
MEWFTDEEIFFEHLNRLSDLNDEDVHLNILAETLPPLLAF